MSKSMMMMLWSKRWEQKLIDAGEVDMEMLTGVDDETKQDA
jgi:hypothetical protein